jgi:hypothetical protein
VDGDLDTSSPIPQYAEAPPNIEANLSLHSFASAGYIDLTYCYERMNKKNDFLCLVGKSIADIIREIIIHRLKV